MKIEIHEARNLCLAILKKNGFSNNQANTIADEYMDGQLRGRECHGLASFITFGRKEKSKSEPIIKETDNYIHIDGQRVKATLILNDQLPNLMKKAKKNSIAMLGMFNAESYLMPGQYARKIAENNLIGLIMNYGGYPRIAPTGSIDPIFGVNPIAVGIPTNDLPLVVDMGTSKQVMGKVRLADKLGRKLDDGVAIDHEGNPTSDPKEAMAGALLPFDGHKGYCITIMIEALTRCLFNVDYKDKTKSPRGYLLICIDPSAFNEDYKSSVAKMIDEIKTSRKTGTEAYYPGERSEKTKLVNLKKGSFEVEDIIINELRELAK